MSSNTPHREDIDLDDLFDDIRGTCDDCQHPRCLGRIESSKAKIESIILEARIAELESFRDEWYKNALGGLRTIKHLRIEDNDDMGVSLYERIANLKAGKDLK